MNSVNPHAPVVTVDGPSGVGKGTLCRWLAGELGWHVLDSGALYRLTALAAGKRGLDVGDESAADRERLTRLATALDVRFTATDNPADPQVWLDSEPVGDSLYAEATGAAASKVAAIPCVRQALLARQRAFRRPPGLIADGRDMGTVVFPDANLKIFLVASPEERAKRRYKQLIEKGINANLAALAQNIAERDARDATRPIAPLKPAVDAVVLDTSGLSIDTVRQRALAMINALSGAADSP